MENRKSFLTQNANANNGSHMDGISGRRKIIDFRIFSSQLYCFLNQWLISSVGTQLQLCNFSQIQLAVGPSSALLILKLYQVCCSVVPWHGLDLDLFETYILSICSCCCYYQNKYISILIYSIPPNMNKNEKCKYKLTFLMGRH